MRVRFLIFPLILILCGGCVSMAIVPTIPDIYEKTMTTESGKELRYTISIPSSFSPDKPLPLILALHYGGQVTPFYGKDFLTLLVEPALRELGAIIVAPDCPGSNWIDPISENAVMSLLNQIMKDYKIDSKKILITGYSMGAVGTWYIVSRQPHLFRAAIPISGIPSVEKAPVVKDVPLYVIHSQKDEIFPIDSVKNLIQIYKSKGVSVHLEVVSDISHYETSKFIGPLKATIPWIRKIWGE